MANWARGLASGLETGVRIGDLLEQRRQREELAKAYGLAPQEQQAPLATPEQVGRAQAETQALAAQDAEMFGLAPQDMQRYAPAMPQEGARTGMSTYRLGEQVLQRAPTQAEIDAARTRAAADVYGRYGDTARREELLRGLRAEQRAQTAEERAAQQFETQQRTAGLTQQQLQQQIAAGGRTAAAAERMDAFTQWAQQNPDQSRDFAAVSAKARELRMTPDEQFKVASSLTGIDEAEFKASQSRIRKLVANQGLDGLLKAHRESDDLDPGSHFEQVRGKDGTITLNRVDTATGRIIQPNVFSGKEAEVVGYLNKAAMDPATIVDYTMNLRKTQAAIEAQEASTAANRATTQLRGLQGRAIREQTAATAEAARIRAEYEALTPEEQAGAKGQGLIRQFNMANVKAGATVPLGAAARPERDKLSPSAQARYDAIKTSDEWRAALTRGDAAQQRALLLRAGITDPADLSFLGVAPPPGTGTFAPQGAPAPTPAPRAAAAPAAPTGPSPARQRQLMEAPMNRFTPTATVEEAAAVGNPEAIRELRRRMEQGQRMTESQMRGLQ